MKIHKLSRIFLLSIVILVLSYFIPKYYWMKFEQNIRPPYVLYSTILHNFMISEYSTGGVVFKNTKGKIYTRAEYERLLPLINYRQLTVSGLFPDSLNGVMLDKKTVGRNNIILRLKPDMIDAPQIQLFPLFESASGRIKLEMPENFFRINSRIEFINTTSNTINEEMSRKFTEVLFAKGFTFPSRLISGNPNERKPFDEGYFIVDGKEKLFHLKMIKGQPFCRKIDTPEGIKVKFISVNENELREYYGVLLSESNEIYLITYNDYRLQKLPVTSYEPLTSTLLLIGDYFNRTITITTDSSCSAFATDRNYKLVGNYYKSWKTNSQLAEGKVADFFFPFSLKFFDETAYLDFHIDFAGLYGIWGIFTALVLALALSWYRYKDIKKNWVDLVVVLFTGMYGLIAISLIKNDE